MLALYGTGATERTEPEFGVKPKGAQFNYCWPKRCFSFHIARIFIGFVF